MTAPTIPGGRMTNRRAATGAAKPTAAQKTAAALRRDILARGADGAFLGSEEDLRQQLVMNYITSGTLAWAADQERHTCSIDQRVVVEQETMVQLQWQ